MISLYKSVVFSPNYHRKRPDDAKIACPTSVYSIIYKAEYQVRLYLFGQGQLPVIGERYLVRAIRSFAKLVY
ncbi:hypothetical protein DSUL_60218 [Desulfovibrionales bacterium]